MCFELENYQLSLKGKPLFKTFSLSVKAGQVGVLSGSSGAGKSTVLSDILGACPAVFQRTGAVRLNGNDLTDLAVEKRHVGILFQDDLLFPHLNVFENLVFGLPANFSKKEKSERIRQALNKAGLGGFENRDVATLSGGQRSRISLLRTLLSQPKLILLDEPFSKLDQNLREQFRTWVFSELKEQNIPVVLVTHDANDIPDGSVVVKLENKDA